MNSPPNTVASQLKLQPPANYSATIAKVQELQLIYSWNSNSQPVNSVRSEERDRIDWVEQTLLQVTEQLSALSSQLTAAQPARYCFNCGQPSHLARNCRSWRMVKCFSCGRTGHLARDRWNQGNGQGGAHRGYPQRLVSAHVTMHTPHTNALTHVVPTLMHNKYTNRVAHTQGTLNNHRTLMLLDSGYHAQESQSNMSVLHTQWD